MNKRRIIFALVAILLISGGIVAFQFYHKIKAENVTKNAFIYIPTKASFEDVTKLIEPYIKDKESFLWVAEKKNYPNKVRAGKFRITKGMSNEQLINHLRGGEPETINLTFNNQDRLDKLSGRIAQQIEPDSLQIYNTITDENFLKRNGFKRQTAIAMYLPNSYQFYWNTSAKDFRDRMLKEYKRFWNSKRLEKAKKLDLTPVEVITLASIVQKETAKVSERRRVAGLYLNRLRDNWPLQADPTVIYAIKDKYGRDTVIKRVLNKDLEIDSPYNTYKNTGLPPGPIAMPDISSIDAVLNPEDHHYYYMCASVDKPGEHEFAKSHHQHMINARKYQKWISKQGINR